MNFAQNEIVALFCGYLPRVWKVDVNFDSDLPHVRKGVTLFCGHLPRVWKVDVNFDSDLPHVRKGVTLFCGRLPRVWKVDVNFDSDSPHVRMVSVISWRHFVTPEGAIAFFMRSLQSVEQVDTISAVTFTAGGKSSHFTQLHPLAGKFTNLRIPQGILARI